MNRRRLTPHTPPRRKGAGQDPSKPRPCPCGRNEGPDPSCEVISWTPRKAPWGPPALGLSLGAGLAHARTARAKTGAECGEQALGAKCWAAGACARARAQMDLSSRCPGTLQGEGLAETPAWAPWSVTTMTLFVASLVTQPQSGPLATALSLCFDDSLCWCLQQPLPMNSSAPRRQWGYLPSSQLHSAAWHTAGPQ